MRVFWIPLLLLSSCAGEETIPSHVLKPSRMDSVFSDYLKADVYAAELLKKDSTRKDTLENLRMQQAIFRHYGITREQFYASLDFYTRHPKWMQPILDSIQQRRVEDKKNRLPKMYLDL